jgi:hypothetical protein
MQINGLEVKIYYERGPIQVYRGAKMSRAAGYTTVEGYTGRTIAIVWDGEKRHVGFSHCHANDQFNRKMGRKIAIQRAFFSKDIVTTDRKNYGKYYFTTTVKELLKDKTIPEELVVRLERSNEAVQNAT